MELYLVECQHPTELCSRIIGDPGRDVRLRLMGEGDGRGRDGGGGLPVAIEPGTKDLVLKRELDREGVLGPSAVNVAVLCERVGGDGGNLQGGPTGLCTGN